MKTILFDTETTGLKNPRLVQLAWKLEGEELKQEFYKPPCPIEFGAMAVHHITEKMVVDKPIFGVNDVSIFTKLFRENIPVAHNLPFDVGVMRNEGVIINGGIDTLKVARHLFPREDQHKLQYLRYSLDLQVSSQAKAHDALGDVYVLDALFQKLLEELSKKYGYNNMDEALNEMIRITGAPSIIYKMQFGKHRGMLMEDLIKKEPGYVKWLLNQSQLDKDVKASIHHFQKKINL